MSNKTIPGRFVKGICPNPNGRPKGAFNDIKKRFLQIQELASHDAKAVYQEIRDKMHAGEAWAYQIYYKELYSLPKKYKEDTVTIPEIVSDDTMNINARLKALIEALDKFEDYTYDEVIAAIKALSTIKTNEVIADKTNTMYESPEMVAQQIKDLKEIIAYAKSQAGENE